MDLVRTLGVAIDPSAAESGGARAQSAFRGVGAAAKETEGAIGGVKSAIEFLKRAVEALAIVELAKHLYEVDTAVVRMQLSLKTASGSTDEFRRNMAFLREESQKFGLDLMASGLALSRFTAEAKGKLGGSEIRAVFTSVSEAATVMGLTTEQTSAVMDTLGQIMSRGAVDARELRMQLNNALPGALKMVADAYGVTETQMVKMMETGNIMGDEMVPKLAKRLHELFGAGAEDEAHALEQEMNRLKNTWLEVEMVFMGEAGETLFGKLLKSAQSALGSIKTLMLGLFQASEEGQLSEAIAASLRIGFGKAANYFGGFVKTAAELIGVVGKQLFTPEYLKALLGSFQSIAAAFGIAFLDALRKPLAYVQAFFEKIFDRLLNNSQYTAIEDKAKADVLATDARFKGKTENQLVTSFGYFTRSKQEDELLQQFRDAVATKTDAMQAQAGIKSVDQRAQDIMATGGVKFGFGETPLSIEDLKKTNDAHLATFLTSLTAQTAGMASSAVDVLGKFQPLNVVDTSKDEATLKGFASRSKSPWADKPPGESPEQTFKKEKTLLSEWQAGIADATVSLTDMFSQARKAGGDMVGSMSKDFTGFFDDIIDGTSSVAQSFTKMTASILRDLAKIVEQRMIAEPLAGGLMNLIGSAAGAYFGGGKGVYGGASDVAYSTADSGSATGALFHSGGIVGTTLGSHAAVNPSIFNHAPRFHNGLAPDEFPAILQRGEEVIPRSEAGRSRNVTIPINVTVDGSKGGSQQQNEKLGAEVARQLKDVVRSVIVEEMMPRGILNPV